MIRTQSFTISDSAGQQKKQSENKNKHMAISLHTRFLCKRNCAIEHILILIY